MAVSSIGTRCAAWVAALESAPAAASHRWLIFQNLMLSPGRRLFSFCFVCTYLCLSMIDDLYR